MQEARCIICKFSMVTKGIDGRATSRMVIIYLYFKGVVLGATVAKRLLTTMRQCGNKGLRGKGMLFERHHCRLVVNPYNVFRVTMMRYFLSTIRLQVAHLIP